MVQISTSALPLGANELALLIRSTDAAFDSSDTFVLLVDNGAGAYEAAIDFNDGDFFTFGKASDGESHGDGVPDYVENKDGANPNDPNSFKDTDGGGTPDYVETVLYPNLGLPAGNPNDPADDNRDSDGGGVSDYQEVKDGTDPTNPADDGGAATPPNGIWLPIISNRTGSQP